jgi:hypothetical protein
MWRLSKQSFYRKTSTACVLLGDCLITFLKKTSHRHASYAFYFNLAGEILLQPKIYWLLSLHIPRAIIRERLHAMRFNSLLAIFMSPRAFKILTSLCVALVFSANLMAEIPPLSEETLKSSPYIITGTVKSIVKRDVVLDECFVRVDFLVTVKRDQSDNTTGAKARPAQHDRVRGHRMHYRCAEQPEGPTGIWGLDSLRKGDKVRIYAIKSNSDGTLVIRQPNGLELIK